MAFFQRYATNYPTVGYVLQTERYSTTMTATERDRRIWQIHDITSRIRPSDMTDAELEAAIAIFRLAEARLPGNRPMLRIELGNIDLGSFATDGTGSA
jgi:hypothetical protein